MKHVLGISAGLLLCLSARADWYVATEANGGNDNNAGTADAPFLTIAKGVAAATAAGCIVRVGEGEFPISATISISKKVSVIGAGRDKTTVKPLTTCSRGFALNHADAELACVKVTGFSGTGNACYGMGVQVGAKGGMVRDCLIEGNTDTGVNYIGGGAGLSLAAGKALRTIIANNKMGARQPGYNTQGGGVYMTGGVLESCLIVSNLVNSSAKYTNAGGGVYATGGTILNCTIADNTCGKENAGGLHVASGSPTIVNTVILANRRGSAELDVTYYDGFDLDVAMVNCATYYGLGTDPVDKVAFADRAHGDYSLPAGSYGLLAGRADGVTFESDTDVDGKARFTSGAVDIGCYQYDATVAAVGIRPSTLVTRAGETIGLTAVDYALSDVQKSYTWTLVGDHGTTDVLVGNPIDFTLVRGGSYDVTVVVSNVQTEAEIVRTVRRGCFYATDLDVYVETTGDDEQNAGWYPDDAFATVERGVARAIELAAEANAAVFYAPTNVATVHLGTGEFTVAEQILLNAPVVVRGEGADKSFVAANANLSAKVDKVHSTFVLQHEDSALEDLTVWKGNYSGQDTYGVGVNMSKGSVRKCTICGNKSAEWRDYGTGIYMSGGLVDHCVVSNNFGQTGSRYGAGIAMTGGRVENSLIVANSLITKKNAYEDYAGAGVWMSGGALVNCTVAGNKTGRSGAGVYVHSNSPQIINCLIGDNLDCKANPPVASDIAYYTGYNTDLIDHCAIPGCEVGIATAAGPVDLKADYTVAASSSAIDAGRDDYAYASEGDLAGNDRKIGEHVDAGCYEYDTSGYAASFTADKETFLCGDEVTLTPTVIGASDDTKLTFAWTLTSDTGVVSNYTDRVVVTAFDIGGHYTVELVVTDPRKGETSSTKENLLYVISMTRYVATAENGGSDDNHGQSPDKPFLSVEKAVAEASDAALNMQADATVHIGEGRFQIAKTLSISQAVHVLGAGRDKTTLTSTTSSPVSYRCFTLNNASAEIAGLTVRDWSVSTSGRQDAIGVCIETDGGFVHDCSFVNLREGFSPNMHGAGVSMVAGHVLRCIITGCASFHNQHDGGGLYMTGGLAESCLIMSNRLQNAKGTWARGGGVFMSGGTLLNCTVTANNADNCGGGLYAEGADTRIINCIVAGNKAGNSDADVTLTSTVSPDNVCNSYLGGTDFGVNPVLKNVDFIAGGYMLRASSWGIDRGNSTEIQLAETDLAGHDRVNGSEVDLGCFEYDQGPFACGFVADSTSVSASTAFTLTPTVFGAPDGANLTYVWVVSNGESVTSNYTGRVVTSAIDHPGYYTITLTVTDTVSGQSVTETRDGYLYVVSLDRYVATEENGGSDENSGFDAEHPFLTVDRGIEAIKEVAGGAAGRTAVLHIGEGTFPLAKCQSVAAAVLVQGEGRDRTILVPEKAGYRAFSLNAAETTVADLCISNFNITGYDGWGGGVYIDSKGGTVRDCRICKCANSAYRFDGGGVYMAGGMLLRTIVEGNSVSQSRRHGAGIRMDGGLVESCLIRGNRFPKFTNDEAQGGGVWIGGGRLVNSTIAGNDCFQRGGGVYVSGSSARIVNCIISGNVCEDGSADGEPEICCSSAAGYACFENCLIGGVPDFTDAEAGDLTLKPDSVAVDAGASVALESATDVYGNPRTSGAAVDLGCCEYQQSAVTGGMSADAVEVLEGGKVKVTGKVLGGAAGLTYSWTLTGVGNGVSASANGNPVEFALTKPGRYTVAMTASDGTTATRESWLYAAPETIFVSAEEVPGSAFPYATPETAATNAQDAVAAAIDGTTVVLMDGVHLVADGLTLNRAITLTSQNGRDHAVLKRASGYARTLTVNGGATVRDIAITGGRLGHGTQTPDTGYWGAGVWVCGRGGLVADCVVTNNAINQSSQYGAGVAVTTDKGRVTRTLIAFNTDLGNSGSGTIALSNGRIDDCLVVSNTPSRAACVCVGSRGTVANCTFFGNTCKNDGAAVYALNEGAPEVVNCVFSENVCLATPERYPSFPYADVGYGYPMWSAAWTTNSSGTVTKNCYPTLTNAVRCCAVVEYHAIGEGSFTCEDAKFVDAAAGDYRITLGSPLRFKGLYEGWMREATDFWGNPRTVGRKRVDVGAFQTQGNGLMLMVR